MADTHRPATYDDIIALPENMVGELIGGRLYTQPRPRIRHASATSRLGILLGGPYQLHDDGPGGWYFLDEPELHFDEDVLVPDVAGWRLERLPEEMDVAALSVAPDWLCEALSPSTQKKDRTVKMDVYAREGVRFVWLLDPDAGILEAFELQGGGWHRYAALQAEDAVASKPFEKISFKLEKLWTLP